MKPKHFPYVQIHLSKFINSKTTFATVWGKMVFSTQVGILLCDLCDAIWQLREKEEELFSSVLPRSPCHMSLQLRLVLSELSA